MNMPLAVSFGLTDIGVCIYHRSVAGPTSAGLRLFARGRMLQPRKQGVLFVPCPDLGNLCRPVVVGHVVLLCVKGDAFALWRADP